LRREELINLLEMAFERSADRLRAEGHQEPWPEDLTARDVVRLLREASRRIIQESSGDHMR